jgi:hypothetical protein
MGGVGTGAAWLAEAGLLRGHRATAQWPHGAVLAERHPELVVSQQLYELDEQRMSCASHQASQDLLIAWLIQRHGERLGPALLAALGRERLRPREERQRLPLAAPLGGGSAKLAEAVALMEANLGEPLPTEEIARLVGSRAGSSSACSSSTWMRCPRAGTWSCAWTGRATCCARPTSPSCRSRCPAASPPARISPTPTGPATATPRARSAARRPWPGGPPRPGCRWHRPRLRRPALCPSRESR